jgi:hypothetical protein
VVAAFGAALPGLAVAGFGAMCGLLSLIGEYVHRIYQLGQGIPFYKLRELDAETERPNHGPRAVDGASEAVNESPSPRR